jgi:hypothetical protein
MNTTRGIALAVLALLATHAPGQTSVYPRLLAEIGAIKAVDNHAHVMRVVAEGERDTEYDAIPCAALEYAAPPPVHLRVDNPIYVGAWRALYGYEHDDMSEEHVRAFLETKRRVMQERGDGYPAWVLDQLGIETILVNRVAMGRGLTGPRFRWVSYADPLMLPLSTRTPRQTNSDVRFFYEQEEKLLARYVSELKLAKLPATLDLYLARVVTPTLERHKRDGAVAVKFVAAYFRSLDFAEVSKGEAEQVYARHVAGREPPPSDYKRLQDYLFRYIASEAGRLGLAVHIHTGGGCGHSFMLSRSNPLLLDPVLNDPSLRKTNFVLVHGGYPFTREVTFLLEKPNVYADFSAQTFLLSPRSLSQVLRDWLESQPEKVLFGTDASPSTPEVSWEESAWLTSTTARQALALALTGLVQDGEITRARASDLAEMVMRGNAMRLYGF